MRRLLLLSLWDFFLTIGMLSHVVDCFLAENTLQAISKDFRSRRYTKLTGPKYCKENITIKPSLPILFQSSSSETQEQDNPEATDSSASISFDSLMDMDIVLYQDLRDDNNNNQEKLKLGAIQEDGTLAPISAWSTEPSFDESIEFLVDEEDRFPGLTAKVARVVKLLPESQISYGSRQVGGGKGPGNPHGEESELLYYVDQRVLEEYNVEIVVKPELEILW